MMIKVIAAILPLLATRVVSVAVPLTWLTDSKAKCLDGTQAGFYYQPAPKEEDSKK